MLKKIFEPIKIGSLDIKNRLVVPPMVVNYVNEDGRANERFISYLEEKAKGGWGLIIPENYAISPEARGFDCLPGLWNDEQIDSHRLLTDRLHKHGSKVFVQLNHAGRQTSRQITGVQSVAPSAIPDPVVGEMPRMLDEEEIKEIIEMFGDAALRAKKAGFDGIEVHGCHGYLINQFMSPFSNKRNDKYGGSIENRARFAVEIINDIKRKTGEDYPIIYRMTVNEFVLGGLNTNDSKVIAMILEEAGVDAIHCTNGIYASKEYIIPPAAVEHGWSSDITAEIKSVVSIPVITVGRINNPMTAESILLSGKADLIAMGRASLADPHMPNKAKDGDFEEIIKCIGCLQGCSGRNSKQLPVKCLVNPMTGNESIYDLGKSVLRKKVLIAGGGIAGMEAAIVAAKRGYYVHLFEKSNLLGGQWLIASVPPYKEELSSLINWQKHQLTQLGVKVYLNKTLTRDIVDFEKPDGVIIATGSEAKKLNFMSIRGDLVISANRILSGEVETGQNILVIGGGSIGVETAVYLAAHDKKVTIIEAGDDLMRDGESVVNHYLFKELIKFDIQVLKNAHVKTISENKVVTYEIDGNMKRMKNIDTIISAIGSMSVNNLSKELKNIEADVITVGDALKVRKGLEAVDEGFKAGLLI